MNVVRDALDGSVPGSTQFCSWANQILKIDYVICERPHIGFYSFLKFDYSKKYFQMII